LLILGSKLLIRGEKYLILTDLIVIAGTRPEVVKLAPIIKDLRKSGIRSELVLSGQHPDLAMDVLPSLNLEQDERLIGVGRQDLCRQ